MPRNGATTKLALARAHLAQVLAAWSFSASASDRPGELIAIDMHRARLEASPGPVDSRSRARLQKQKQDHPWHERVRAAVAEAAAKKGGNG